MAKTCVELREERAALLEQARNDFEAAEARPGGVTAEDEARFDKTMSEADGKLRQAERLERLEGNERGLNESLGRRSQPLDEAGGRWNEGGHTDDPLPHQRSGRHQYQLLRALRRYHDTGRIDGLEGETSAELARRSGAAPKGFLVPLDLPVPSAKRSGVLNTTTAAGAIYEMPAMQTIAGLLRNRVLAAALGCTFLTGLMGKTAIPRATAGATFGWVAEGTGGSASNAVIGQVSLEPTTLTGYTELTRTMLAQTGSLDMEMFARNDLGEGLAVALDRTVFAGSGVGVEPVGLTTYPGITTLAMGTNGGPPTWDAVVGLESAVAAANADVGKLGYATNAAVRGKCKTTPKVSGYPSWLWEEDGINGYLAGISNSVPSTLTKGSSSGVCSALFFGNWADLLIGLWGGVDVLPDPYTQATSGTLRIHIYQDADIALRRTESFARIVDLTTAA